MPDSDHFTDPVKWPHAPPHFLATPATYMVTAATHQKSLYFNSRLRLRHLTECLLACAVEHEWSLEAWAVFANHYHFIGKSPSQGAQSLPSFLAAVHRRSATWLNRLDGIQGRKVWHNYWETELSFEKSYLARLNYVMHNPVKHGLVKTADHYPWCSASWFQRNASSAFQKTIESMPIDQVKVRDDF